MLPSSVLFERGDSNLKAEATEALSIVQDIYNKSKNKDILIEGHTYNLGSPEYNLELSMKRARSVSDYLAHKMGIPANRIRIMYYGERFPIASNSTEEGRARNRRVSVRFLPRKAKIAQK
ncbi:MAG: OmpA family protein [Nitrospirota bacterium]